MREERFGGRIRQALNYGLQDISPASGRRLEAARHLALTRQKQAELQLAAAGKSQGHAGFGHDYRYLRQILSILALLVGMWIAFYWHSEQYVSELEEVDSALLSDDLPPEAYIDKDFHQWLKDSSEE